MPALSKKQQKFMGIVRSIQKGEQPASKFNKDAQDVAKDMKKSDVKKFASTKHKGLPMKKEILNKLKEMIRQELSEYTYGVGDIVKDVNPTCLHYGAIGKVKEVNPEYVTFVVMNNGDRFKKGQTLEKSHDQMKKMNETINEITFTPIDKIKDIKNLVKKGLVSYRGASGGFEISIRNKKVPGFPPSSELLYSGDPKKQKQYRDIRKKQFSIKPIATYFIKSDDLRKLQKFGQVSFLAPNKKESVNEINDKFVKYMNDFYGPKGLYVRTKKPLTLQDINKAYSILLKKRPRYQWADGDAFDRENLRDELIKLRILSKDLMNKKESINEFSIKLQKSTQDMVDALLKVKSPMPKEIESALIMMAKGYGLDYVKREVQRDAKGFYKNLKQMAAAFPEFKKNPKDYKFESIIQERNDEVQTGKEYTKLWLQSIGLVIKQANNLKGALAKHPVKRDLNKLKAVENLFKKFIKPAIETERASSRHYAPNQTELKKYLSNSKFKVAVRILKQTLQSSNGYDENSWWDLDDKTKKLIEKMGKVLYDIENKMDNANLESVNEGKGVDKIMKIVDTQSFGKLAGQTVDTLSASLFKQVYDKASQGAKDKINQMNERQLLVFMNKLWMRFGKGLSGQMMS